MARWTKGECVLGTDPVFSQFTCTLLVHASFDGGDGCLRPFWAFPLISPAVPLSCSHFHFVFLSVILLFLILFFFIFPLLMLMRIVWGTILEWISHGIYILISLLVGDFLSSLPSIIIFCNKCPFHFLNFPLSPGDLVYKRYFSSCTLIQYLLKYTHRKKSLNRKNKTKRKPVVSSVQRGIQLEQ